MSNNNARSAVEALLFSSGRPLALEQMKSVLELETSEIRALLGELRAEYQAANRGVRVTEVAGGFQMITAPDFAVFLKKLYKQRRVEKLSKPAMETLAMVAYKQPVTKSEIEALRNVNVDGVVETLLNKGLVRVAGRKKAPGRPRVYGTTRRFLEYFGLKSLDELPKIENFPKPLNVDAIEEEQNVAEKITPTN